jgi:hypothetical protein
LPENAAEEMKRSLNPFLSTLIEKVIDPIQAHPSDQDRLKNADTLFQHMPDK